MLHYCLQCDSFILLKVFLNQQQVWMGLDGARGVAMAAICQMNRKWLISVFDLTAHAHT